MPRWIVTTQRIVLHVGIKIEGLGIVENGIGEQA